MQAAVQYCFCAVTQPKVGEECICGWQPRKRDEKIVSDYCLAACKLLNGSASVGTFSQLEEREEASTNGWYLDVGE